MQPLHCFLALFIFVKCSDVWFEKGSTESVVSMGYAVNCFALVRVFFKVQLKLGVECETSCDRALIPACVTNFPVAIGPTGCVQLVSVIFAWNALLELLLPDMRNLLQVNRSVADVFPDEFNGKTVDFHGTLAEFKQKHPEDEHLAVARAAFHIIAGENNTIELEEVQELFEGWGLPDACNVAKQVFGDTDTNHDGVVDFEEFKVGLWFIWSRLYDVGEAEHTADGKLKVTNLKSMHDEEQKKQN